MKKYTICLNLKCNLACSYCYIRKSPSEMSPRTVTEVVNFMFSHNAENEDMSIGFFGGEPLLSFELLKLATKAIEGHPSYNRDRTQLAVVTNGTLFNQEIARFLNAHSIAFCLSCDGPKNVQDLFRTFPDGSSSASAVEETIRRARDAFPLVLVNAVYHPRGFRLLPDVIEYFASMGITQIYLNADYSARWSPQEIECLPSVYEEVGRRYAGYFLRRHPLFVSLLDSKIAVIMRGGYQSGERCQMGGAEIAIAPDGSLFPCERLIEDGGSRHCIGNVMTGIQSMLPACIAGRKRNATAECQACGLNEYCMNWCGCSNWFSTGSYDTPGAFLCASERASISVAFSVFQQLESQVGSAFVEHLSGRPSLNSVFPI